MVDTRRAPLIFSENVVDGIAGAWFSFPVSQPHTKMKTNIIHSYAVEVMINGIRTDIDVEAKNRRQAEAMVRKMGHEVRSVNMLS